MKDVEVVATLLLLLEEGVKGYSQPSLDEAFSKRDGEWEHGAEVIDEFRCVVEMLANLVKHPDGQFLVQSRFRNQADFYSLFGAVAELMRDESLPDDLDIIGSRLRAFLEIVEDEGRLEKSKAASVYYDAARSASNDVGPRQTRINVMKRVLRGEDVSQ